MAIWDGVPLTNRKRMLASGDSRWSAPDAASRFTICIGNEMEYGPIDFEKIKIVQPNYVCPVHGEIGNQTLHSTLIGLERRFCLRCCIEKLEELGISQVKEMK